CAMHQGVRAQILQASLARNKPSARKSCRHHWPETNRPRANPAGIIGPKRRSERSSRCAARAALDLTGAA
ncbi:MAG: hypothetical protein ABS956_12365, partial [Pseudomonas sp.]|uniref:hypothetical protein n=1 Tax=Pseudomonas sp. TaxID=306 RepID=UPI003315C1F1